MLQQVGVFRRFLAVVPGLVADLDPAEPLSPTCCLPSPAPRGGSGSPVSGRSRLAVHSASRPCSRRAPFPAGSSGHSPPRPPPSGKDPRRHCRSTCFFPEEERRGTAGIRRRLWIMPWVNCTPFNLPRRAIPCRKLPRIRGNRSGSRAVNRIRSSMVKTSGVSTSPLIISRCWPGSTSATPEWCRLEAQAVGGDDPLQLVQRREVTDDTLSAVRPVDVAPGSHAPRAARARHRAPHRRPGRGIAARAASGVIAGSAALGVGQLCPVTGRARWLTAAPVRNWRRDGGEFQAVGHGSLPPSCAQPATSSTVVLGSMVPRWPCSRMWFSNTSQIGGPSVPSFTLAQPATM